MEKYNIVLLKIDSGEEVNSVTSKVYLVQKGRQALQKDIVNIWEYCDIKYFPTTIEQKNFIEEWCVSLKERYYVD